MNTAIPGPADVKVSVAMITYNHERFIAQSIEGVLMQQTDFAVELVIGEDCSTDGTRAIVRRYGERHPERIRLLLPERNLGADANLAAVLKACRGQYVALLEGDDYWTDPTKLQKQVDFLEEHPDYVLCHHDAVIVDENGALIKNSKLPPDSRRDFSGEELIKGALILTLTACFRHIVTENPPEHFRVLNSDTFLFSLLGNYGRSKYLGDTIKPDAYRVHSGGVWSSQADDWLKAYHLLNTYYWLRMYYERLGKKEYAQSFSRALLHANLLYRLPCAEEVESTLVNHLERFEGRLSALNDTSERNASMRACLSANLYVGGAFASFGWQRWERGRYYLEQAVQLDPDAWSDGVSLESMLVNQGAALAESSGGIDGTRLHNYLVGIRHHFPKKLELPEQIYRRVEGRIYAEAAYRCHLAMDVRGVRYNTRHALQSNPLLVKDIGMLRRALRL